MCLITSHLRGRTPANKHMSNSEPNHLRGSALEKLHPRDVWSRGEPCPPSLVHFPKASWWLTAPALWVVGPVLLIRTTSLDTRQP